MENLIISLNVVLPLFIIIVFGYIVRKINLIDDYTLQKMNIVVFKTFLPLLLFYNVYKTKLEGVFNLKLMVFALLSILISCLFMCVVIPMLEKENKRRGVLIQAIFRSNFVLFGLPIVLSLCGEENAGITSLLIAVIVPMFNFLAVIILESFRGGKIQIGKIIKGIISNPLILASLCGIIFLLLGIKLPKAVDKSISDMSKVATPLALFILGGSFKVSNVRNNIKPILIGTLGKLVLVPGIFIPIAIWIGFRGVELASVMIMLAAPTAVSSFTMAEQMDGDGELAAQLVVFTSALAVITIFLWVFITKQFGYL